MGWIPWSSGDSSKTTASDGGRIAPDRTSRARCWEGRDLFFACLDKNDILDGIKEDGKARQKCAKEVAEFEEACSKSWVCTGIGCLRIIRPFLGRRNCLASCSYADSELCLGEILQGKASDGIQPG